MANKTTKVYFDANSVALGTVDDYPSYSGDYYASEEMRVPVGLVVNGMTFDEIKQAASAEFRRERAAKKSS